MGIRYDKNLNKRVSRIVRNYNQRVRRANKLGKINKSELPETVSIKTLKKSYSNRRDLESELRNLELFSRKDARTKFGDINAYEAKVFEENRIKAIHYFEKQLEYAKNKVKNNFPGEMNHVRTLEANLDLLKSGIGRLNSNERRAAVNYVNKYRKSFERQATGYRGFLSEVDLIMQHLEIDKDTRDKLFEKFSVLNEEEFFELYNNNELINKIYMLADSPKYTGGKIVLHETERETRRLIESLMENIDVYINDIKK